MSIKTEGLAIRARNTTESSFVGGRLTVDGTSNSDSIGNGTEVDLTIYTLKGGTLDVNGDGLNVMMAGEEFGTLSKTIKLYFGTTVIMSQTTSSSGVWLFAAQFIRKSATSIQYLARFFSKFGGVNATDIAISTAGPTLSADNVIKITHITTSTGATPYSTEYSFLCDFIPNS